MRDDIYFWAYSINTHDRNGNPYPAGAIKELVSMTRGEALESLRQAVEADGVIFDLSKVEEKETAPIPERQGLRLNWLLKYDPTNEK